MAVALTSSPSVIRLRRAQGFWDRLIGLAWRSAIDPDQAFRIAACLSGAHVIEFACGLISKLQIMPGDQILFGPSALTITRKAAGGHRDQFELGKRV